MVAAVLLSVLLYQDQPKFTAAEERLFAWSWNARKEHAAKAEAALVRAEAALKSAKRNRDLERAEKKQAIERAQDELGKAKAAAVAVREGTVLYLVTTYLAHHERT